MKRRSFAVLLVGIVCALTVQGQGAGQPAAPPESHGMGRSMSHGAPIKVMILDGQSGPNWSCCMARKSSIEPCHCGR